MRLSDFTEINPYEKLPKGTIAKKISMEQLEPYKKFVSGYSLESYSGGAKFRNGDTIMARITPCLENGKTAFVSTLEKNEVGFGSTEYIVFRAKDGISYPDFVYYLVISSLVREPAIKSMVGSSGRQRVQQTVIDELEIPNYSLAEQQHIVDILGSIDNSIENNEEQINKINALAMSFVKKGDNPHAELKPYIKFIKGKKPIENGSTSAPYLSIDAITSFRYESVYSDDMIMATPYDILMVMDGASSGTVFSHQSGVVSSTLAKIESKKEIKDYLYWFLLSLKDTIKTRNTGSAIPHANKDYISSLKFDYEFATNASNTTFLHSLRTKIVSLQEEIVKLRELKALYLKKFFE